MLLITIGLAVVIIAHRIFRVDVLFIVLGHYLYAYTGHTRSSEQGGVGFCALGSAPWLLPPLRLMDKILHDPKDSKLWELWYIPYYGSCRILSINRPSYT